MLRGTHTPDIPSCIGTHPVCPSEKLDSGDGLCLPTGPILLLLLGHLSIPNKPAASCSDSRAVTDIVVLTTIPVSTIDC